jgi:mono/diheme cytochrome c family protein
MRRALLLSCVLLIAGCAEKHAAAPRDFDIIATGHDLALMKCAQCHGIGPMDESPFESAPPFGRIVERFPVENLARDLTQGIARGHGEMPPFSLQPQESEAVLAYLASLYRHSDKGFQP